MYTPQDPVSRAVRALREQASPTPSSDRKLKKGNLNTSERIFSNLNVDFDEEASDEKNDVLSPLNDQRLSEARCMSPPASCQSNWNKTQTPQSESPVTKARKSLHLLLDQDYKKVLHEQEIEYKAQIQSVRNIAVITLAVCCVHLFLGVVYYSLWPNGVQWPIEETLLFLIYTASTVGYGNHDIPSSPTDRIVTIIFLLSGIALVTVLLSEIFQYLVIQTSRVVSAHEKKKLVEEMTESSDSNQSLCSKISSAVLGLITFWENILSRSIVGRTFLKLFPFLFLVILGASVVGSIEKWSAIDALYWVVVTLTTVGYGDLTPTKPASIWFSIFYLPFSTIFISYFLSKVAGAYMILHIKQIARMERKLKRKSGKFTPNDSSKPSNKSVDMINVDLDNESTTESRYPISSNKITLKDMLDEAKNIGSQKDHRNSLLIMSPTPTLTLRSIVQERLTCMIAHEFHNTTPTIKLKDGAHTIHFSNWNHLTKKWKIPIRVRDPLKVAVFDLLLSVGINHIRLRGTDALLEVNQQIFNPTIAAFGSTKYLDAWLCSTDELIQVER